MAEKKATGKATTKAESRREIENDEIGQSGEIGEIESQRQSDESQKSCVEKSRQEKIALESGAKKGAAKAKRKARKRKSFSKATSGLDKSVAQFRESLEQSVTLSRDRIQDVVDDAVKRGRMTRSDAEKCSASWSKKAANSATRCCKELERLAKQARKALP